MRRSLPFALVLALTTLAACAGGDAAPTPEASAGAPEPSPLSGAGASAGESPTPSPQPRPPLADLTNGHGIDISHHSGVVDWDAVLQSGYVFAYLKATEGVDDPDPTFRQHWEALAARGINRGAYHFYVTEDDPLEQARFFLDNVDHQPGDLAPVVDIELLGHGTVGDVAPRLHRFLDEVEKEVGVPPIIYTSPKFWNAHLDDSFSRYPLWIAEYDVDEPTIPGGWQGWTIWQFEGDADVPGVEKGADRSRIHPEIDVTSIRVPERPPAPTSGG